ncbi:c-type cytochrome [Deinococcus phoenicis]|uniref:c-type cytochrome n=1 Tax=Deinococcus phoenicis TaxID=1476583 RepID=UPI0004B54B81|nr:cytochrome c [Deinococcus phoenicis]
MNQVAPSPLALTRLALLRSARFQAALSLAVLLAGGAGAASPDGKALFTSNCAGCHQATGRGVPGAFPALAGDVGKLLATQGGRAYIGHVVLFGLNGKISAGGQTYNGVMPAFGQLKDADLAAILNYVSTSWGNKLPSGQKPFTAAELAKDRQDKKTSAQMNTLRPKTVK